MVASSIRLWEIFRDRFPSHLHEDLHELFRLARDICLGNLASKSPLVEIFERLDRFIQEDWDVSDDSPYNSLITLAALAGESSGVEGLSDRTAIGYLLGSPMNLTDDSFGAGGRVTGLVEIGSMVWSDEALRVLGEVSAILDQAINRPESDPIVVFQRALGREPDPLAWP